MSANLLNGKLTPRKKNLKIDFSQFKDAENTQAFISAFEKIVKKDIRVGGATLDITFSLF